MSQRERDARKSAGGLQAAMMFVTPRTHLRQRVGQCPTARLSARFLSSEGPHPKAIPEFEAPLQSPTYWRTWQRRNGHPLGDSFTVAHNRGNHWGQPGGGCSICDRLTEPPHSLSSPSASTLSSIPASRVPSQRHRSRRARSTDRNSACDRCGGRCCRDGTAACSCAPLEFHC